MGSNLAADFFDRKHHGTDSSPNGPQFSTYKRHADVQELFFTSKV